MIIDELSNILYLASGGIGTIFINQNQNIYKVLLIKNIYENNINIYNLLKDKIPIVKLYNFFIYNISKINIRNINILEDVNNKKKYLDNFDENNIKLYILEYQQMDTNLYHYIIKILENNNEITYKINFIIYSIYMSLIFLLELQNYNICHNDFKLDNILIKNNDFKKEYIFYFLNNSIYIKNLFNYSFYLNDFDITQPLDSTNKNNDFLNFKKKIIIFLNNYGNKLSNKEIKKVFKNIENKLNKTENIDNVYNIWFKNSSTYKHLTESKTTIWS